MRRIPGDELRRLVEFFCSTHKGCAPDSEVTRIEWSYLEPVGE